MKELSDISTIKSIMERHGFSFSKSLGQNFIIDSDVCPKIADSARLDSSTAVIEIGAGIGVLTKELAERSRSVFSFEIDKRLIPVLDETLADYGNTEIINADFMKTDISAFITEKCAGADVCVCANLPYYITSPVIMKLLEERAPVKSITVMVQKEAADRLCAEPGGRDCGAVSAAVSYYAEQEKLFFVPRTAFFPSPKVDSEVIRLTVRKAPPVAVEDEKTFFRVIRAAFSQRRKTLLNSLSSGLALTKDDTRSILEDAGIDLNIRAERLTLADFAAVTDRLCDLQQGT